MAKKMSQLKLAEKRTELAHERTMLAYFRTAAALLLFGLGFIGFGSDSRLLLYTGWFALGLGIFFSLVAIRRSVKYQKEMKKFKIKITGKRKR